MTDDDTKFERARREKPHIEAFAQIASPVDAPQPRDVLEHDGRRRRTFREVLAGWAAHDEVHGVPRDGP